MTPKLPIYLDAHSTTPCDPRVFEAMAPCFTRSFGNASSRSHSFGWEAEALVERAREQVAALVRCNPREIVFTSGATESNNLAIKGLARRAREMGRHIITSEIEHKSVLDPCHALEQEGFEITRLPVGEDGRIRLEDLNQAIRNDTVLVSIMFANNEIGSINPISAIGELCKRRKVFFHCDAVQALAYVPFAVQLLGVDLLSISAHKMCGPKGVGALYVRRRDPRVQLEPLLDGGGQERGIRSGTLNVPGIVGLGKACEIAMEEMKTDALRIAGVRDRLLHRIIEALPETVINGGMDHRLPNNLNLAFPGVDADAVMSGMSGVAVSSGSACTSESLEPSYVLSALGISQELAHGSIRFGLTRFTTAEEIEYAADQIIQTVRRLRQLTADEISSCRTV